MTIAVAAFATWSEERLRRTMATPTEEHGMEYVTAIDDGIEILSPSGRFDAFAAPQIAEELARIQAASDRLVVDLSAVPFIDSTGLATLVRAMKHAREQNASFVLCGLVEPVRIIFELTRLDRAFDIADDCASALATLRQ